MYISLALLTLLKTERELYSKQQCVLSTITEKLWERNPNLGKNKYTFFR